MDIYKKFENIKTQQDFIDFLQLLKRDYQENKEEWENDSLESFLEGLHGYCLDKPQDTLTWKTFAEILLASKVYE